MGVSGRRRQTQCQWPGHLDELGNGKRASVLLRVPYHLVIVLKSPDLGTRYPPALSQPGCSFRAGKLSVFADLLRDEQKPGLHVCSFLCILLSKLMIMGLPPSLCPGPTRSPPEIAPCSLHGFPRGQLFPLRRQAACRADAGFLKRLSLVSSVRGAVKGSIAKQIHEH